MTTKNIISIVVITLILADLVMYCHTKLLFGELKTQVEYNIKLRNTIINLNEENQRLEQRLQQYELD